MQVVILTSRERDLLRILVKNANQIVSRQTLLLSNGRQQASERSVDVDVTRLRQKIEEDPRMPKYLKTIRGYGYQLVTDISYKKIVTGALA
jgi:two-component system phosphate regulon response regulator OmpR